MANVDIPYSATSAAATSSWVLKGLLAQRMTFAPPAFKVMPRFAVSVVMCRQAAIVVFFKGCSFSKRFLICLNTGMSRAAQFIL